MNTTEARERRRAVRLRPTADLPAEARLVGREQDLQVWDVSVGGLAIAKRDDLDHLELGSRHRLRLGLGRYGEVDVEVEVRHRGGDVSGTIGLMFVEPPSEVTTALGRYVAELLERGALS